LSTNRKFASETQHFDLHFADFGNPKLIHATRNQLLFDCAKDVIIRLMIDASVK
jgi:hypothetical protein